MESKIPIYSDSNFFKYEIEVMIYYIYYIYNKYLFHIIITFITNTKQFFFPSPAQWCVRAVSEVKNHAGTCTIFDISK